MRWKVLVPLSALLVLTGLSPRPQAGRFVFDHEHLFDLVQGSRLDSLVHAHERITGNEIAVVTTASLHGHPDLPSFAATFGDSLGVGKKGRDNGVVIAVSRTLRSVFIATGYGTEKVLTDADCAAIVDELMIPHFRKDEFAEGVWAGTLAIVQHLEKPGNRIP